VGNTLQDKTVVVVERTGMTLKIDGGEPLT
jgi:hypothetical protein